MKLSSIAEVRTGLVLARKQSAKLEDVKNTYKLLTLAAIDGDGQISEQNIDIFFSKEEISVAYFTKVGDVIVRLSSPNISVAIVNHFQDLLIPSQFAIIRGDQKQILSGYLSVFLNGKIAQAELSKARNGTVIQTISTLALKELEINCLSIDRQQKIVELSNLIKINTTLQNKIANLEKLIFNEMMNKLLRGENK